MLQEVSVQMDRLAEEAGELDDHIEEYRLDVGADDLSWDDAQVHDGERDEAAEEDDLSWDDAQVHGGGGDEDTGGDTDDELSWEDAQVHDGS